MSIETMAIVLNHSKAKGTDKVVLMGIANHDGDLGAHPGIPTLARYANVAESSAREAVRRLEALGEVRVRPGEGKRVHGGTTNGYDVLVECPPECDRSKNHRLREVETPTGGPVGVDNSTPTGGPVPPPTGGPVPPPTGPPVPNRPRTVLEPSPQPPEAPVIPPSVVQLWEGEGISNEDQAALWAALLADPETHVPAARARQRAWYVPTLAKIHAASGKTLAAHVETIRRHGEDCDHGFAGGAELHPTTGMPLCPLCRVRATA